MADTGPWVAIERGSVRMCRRKAAVERVEFPGRVQGHKWATHDKPRGKKKAFLWVTKRSTQARCSVLKKPITSAIMSGAGVEELYKNYGILADAGDKVSEVRVSFVPPPTFTMVPTPPPACWCLWRDHQSHQRFAQWEEVSLRIHHQILPLLFLSTRVSHRRSPGPYWRRGCSGIALVYSKSMDFAHSQIFNLPLLLIAQTICSLVCVCVDPPLCHQELAWYLQGC